MADLQEVALAGDNDVDVQMTNGADTNPEPSASKESPVLGETEWHVIAVLEAAHGVFEINHVCWTRRYDKNKRDKEEEIIMSTGDEGEVKIWTLDEVAMH